VYQLSQQHDIRQLVVETILTYLELDGVLQATQPFFAEYKVFWQVDEEAVLSRFDARRAQFLRDVFACGQKGRKWLRLDVHQAALTLKEPRERIIKALNYLEEQGYLQLQASGVRKGYRRLQAAADARALVERFRLREQRDLTRLQEMQRLTQSQGCTARALLAYFGETLADDCGVCGSCQGRPPRPGQLLAGAISPEQMDRVQRLRSQAHPALQHPRQLARFLCGLTSPASSAARLGKHPDFGALADLPFQHVLEALQV
ncbi:MAG: RecQ family zinc-binding domain-containing protein, partial [Candidatus Eremiobacteraeota bacterium]|nr:RecQ family zinc-binding domain-containing protein [Candidatus Eremiobacteraeota bacterium]